MKTEEIENALRVFGASTRAPLSDEARTALKIMAMNNLQNEVNSVAHLAGFSVTALGYGGSVVIDGEPVGASVDEVGRPILYTPVAGRRALPFVWREETFEWVAPPADAHSHPRSSVEVLIQEMLGWAPEIGKKKAGIRSRLSQQKST